MEVICWVWVKKLVQEVCVVQNNEKNNKKAYAWRVKPQGSNDEKKVQQTKGSKALDQIIIREEPSNVQTVIIEEHAKVPDQNMHSRDVLIAGGSVEVIENREDATIDKGKKVVDVEESQ